MTDNQYLFSKHDFSFWCATDNQTDKDVVDLIMHLNSCYYIIYNRNIWMYIFIPRYICGYNVKRHALKNLWNSDSYFARYDRIDIFVKIKLISILFFMSRLD